MEKNDPRTWSYEDALNNFDAFCNYFDAASATAAARVSKSQSSSRGATNGTHETAIDATVLPPPEFRESSETAGSIERIVGEDPR